MPALTDLLELATEVRAEFEAAQIPPELLAWLYRQYNREVEAATFVAEAAKLFPRLNCGLACVYLRHRLGLGRIIRGRYGDEAHTFLLVHGRTVMDITADQYGGPPVYVGPLVLPWALPRLAVTRGE